MFLRSVSRNLWKPVLVAVGIGLGAHSLWRAVQDTTFDSIPDEIEMTKRGPTELVSHAQAALKANDFVSAELLANEALLRDPKSFRALLVAAEAATKLDRPDSALDYYARIPDDGSQENFIGLVAAGSLLMRAGQLSASLQRFERAVELDPTSFEVRSRVAYLLNTGGRRWESMPHLFELVRQRQFTIEHLLLLGNVDEVINQRELLEKCREIEPDDPLPALGLARIHLAQGRFEEAKEIAVQLFEFNPLDIGAHVILGQLLIDAVAEPNAYFDWHDGLPEGANSHPDIWYIRGCWAQLSGELPAAVRCFSEALDRNPNHHRATHRLGVVLQKLGRIEAKFFQDRAVALERLASTLHPLYSGGPEQARMVQIARQMESLGRIWEACAWYHAVLGYFPNETSIRQERSRLEKELAPDLPLVLASQQAKNILNLDDYPLPAWHKGVGKSEIPVSEPAPAVSPVFTDRAQHAGLEFKYFCGDDWNVPGIAIYLNLGGGVGVLDYDADGWPDVYLSQGSAWPPDTGNSRQHTDRLFRNLGNGRFQDVTSDSGLGDTDYSQGVSVGDFNNDGFPDLYLANIGQNRLYYNRGDGSFEDVTEAAGVAGSHWTSSCLIADLSGDGLPDIYDVTYLKGPGPFETVCKDGTEVRTCTPAHFDAEDDRFFLNLGDGRFEDRTKEAGFLLPEGKGLGLLAADFEGDGLLELFVANDTTPNQLFVNQAKGRAPALFTNEAVVRGIALDLDGRAQACMGVACGDANSDGLLDLFVTNFYNESNTLYEQLAGGEGFSDTTRHYGLRESSFPMLGFGTQFLDGDLDGHQDLVVANGHIDDWTYKNIPFRMRPQFFRNLGGERFVEIRDPKLGEFFAGKYLARSLARIDWNRDGAEDFIISHLDTPVALLTNETRTLGNFLKLRFVGVTADRDAIGTTATVKVGNKTLVRQLTAGDGYQASNDRCVVFGLGQSDVIETLAVRWPSGLNQEFTNVVANQELIIREGHAEPVRCEVFSTSLD